MFDGIWPWKSWSIHVLVEVTGCCLMAPSHYLNQCQFIDNWTLRNKLQCNFNQNTIILLFFLHENEHDVFENGVCKMVAILSRPPGVNGLPYLVSTTRPLAIPRASRWSGSGWGYHAKHWNNNSNILNPLHAKFFRGNINIYLHFMSLLHIDLTQVLKMLPQVRPGPTYSA